MAQELVNVEDVKPGDIMGNGKVLVVDNWRAGFDRYYTSIYWETDRSHTFTRPAQVVVYK